MREIPLTAMKRTKSGKGSARGARREGLIPGVVYGPEIEPISVAVDERQFRSAMRKTTGASIIDLDVEGKKNKVVLRELQRDPVTSHIVHIDFHAISMNRPIHIALPIHLTGTAVGVKTDGGIMQQTMRELLIESLPKDIPDDITVDVTELGIGDSVHVSELELPNVKILSDPKRTVVTIAAPTVMKVEAVTEGEEVAVEGEEAEEAAAEGEEAEAAEATEGDTEEKEGKKEGKKE
jgi:large subunit ribosomal protein L25